MTHDNEDRPPVNFPSLSTQMRQLLAHEATFPIPKPTVADHEAAPKLGPEWSNEA